MPVTGNVRREDILDWDEDRRRTQQWISELEQLLQSPDLEASPEARLTAFATAANAEALLLFADTLHHAMGTLRDDLVPQVRAILGDLQLPRSGAGSRSDWHECRPLPRKRPAHAAAGGCRHLRRLLCLRSG
jgi:hypothetical protein